MRAWRTTLIHLLLSTFYMLGYHAKTQTKLSREIATMLSEHVRRNGDYLFAAYTGLRYGEIAALRVDDLNFEQAFILARSETTKNRRSRSPTASR